MLDTNGIIEVLRLITGASHLTTLTPCYTMLWPALSARDESQQPSRQTVAGFCMSSELAMKQCRKCEKWKEESEFRPQKRKCRECERLASKAYNAARAERRRAYAKQYRQNYPGGPQALDKKRYQQNAEQRRAYTQSWREENRERYLAYKRSDQNRASNRAYYHRNKDRMRLNGRLYRQNNKDRVNAKTHRRRARKKGNGGAFTAMQWRLLCRKYNYRCLACGKREPDIKLTIDHVLPIQQGGTNTIDNFAPIASLVPVSLNQANDLLVAWEHKMGALARGNQNAWCHALLHNGEPVAVTTASYLIAARVGGAPSLTRENTIELSRLCAARSSLCRVMLRLWREFVFPALGFPCAMSYQDADLHTGNTYRFDGWKRVAYARSGPDTRSGRAGRNKWIWVWPDLPALAAVGMVKVERQAA